MLASGVRGYAAEYGGYQPDDAGVSRISYGAFLCKRTGFPLMIAGGSTRKPDPGYPDSLSTAAIMDRYALRHFGVGARWLEEDSRTTEQNAQFSVEVLKREGVRRVLLVTSSLHMRRAKMLFERQGIDVSPAATQAVSPSDLSAIAVWVPHTGALNLSRQVLHEFLGLMWYRLIAD